MAASPSSTFGVRIVGIDPENEGRVTSIKDILTEGTYFEADRKNPVIIGTEAGRPPEPQDSLKTGVELSIHG